MRRRAPRARPQIRSQAEFEALYGAKAPAGKRYFHHTRLPEIIGAYPLKPAADEGRERERRQAFLDFLLGVLARARGGGVPAFQRSPGAPGGGCSASLK